MVRELVLFIVLKELIYSLQILVASFSDIVVLLPSKNQRLLEFVTFIFFILNVRLLEHCLFDVKRSDHLNYSYKGVSESSALDGVYQTEVKSIELVFKVRRD